MSILVVAEHQHGMLQRATRHAVTAALQCGAEVDVLVLGNACSGAADEAAKLGGVRRVRVVDHPIFAYPLAESMAPLIAALAKEYSHVLASATSVGKDVLPRVAALLDVQQISEIVEVLAPGRFRRPIYAGNALEVVQSHDGIKIITVRTTTFAPAPLREGAPAAIEAVNAAIPENNLSRFVSAEERGRDRPELTSARIVISGGRGLGSAEQFAMIERLAEKLGAAVGASRAAVDAGYVPNDYQVGQTGKIVAPDLYIAVGISGAIQHLAGMKDSKIIVAINKDENAPIFAVADYGLVGDLFQLVPELERLLLQ